MPKRYMTTSEFISKAKDKHCGKYDYTSTIYTTSKNKITITCKEHGDFTMVAARHLYGANCPKCAIIIRATKRTSPFSEFVNKANIIHNNRYTYSPVGYKNAASRICVTCEEHGVFKQKVNNHLNGQNCPSCAAIARPKAKTFTTHEFVFKSTNLHGAKYDYSKVVYVGYTYPVTLVCKEHGEFSQLPSVHLTGAGCPKCGGITTIKKLSSSTKEFIYKATLLHKGLYSYSKVAYVNNATKVSITCPVHGAFYQTPSGHLQGLGCRECSPGGFNSDKPGTLYYLKVTKPHCRTLYKIGITNKSVEHRFGKDDLSYITIVWTKEFQNGKECYEEEQRILKKV